MLKLKDLKNRVYDGKECIRFEWHHLDMDGDIDLELVFRSVSDDGSRWQVTALLLKPSQMYEQLYQFTAVKVSSRQTLPELASMALNSFSMALADEVAFKSALAFDISAEIGHDNG